MSQGVDEAESSGVNGVERGDEQVTSELWNEVRDDVEAIFGAGVDFTVYEYDDHLDVRVMPNGALADVEEAHDVRLVPYTACRLTIRKDQ